MIVLGNYSVNERHACMHASIRSIGSPIRDLIGLQDLDKSPSIGYIFAFFLGRRFFITLFSSSLLRVLYSSGLPFLIDAILLLTFLNFKATNYVRNVPLSAMRMS